MNNNQKKDEIGNVSLDKIKEKYISWVVKVNKLKDEIKALSDLQSNPIVNAPTLSIGVFLLKSEVIEFELKQIISTFDSAINSELTKNKYILIRKIRYPGDLYELTLGQTIGLFCEFESKTIPDELKTDLKKLNALRNDFTHHIFNQHKSIDDLKKEACDGIKISDLILNYLNKLNEFLKK